MIKLEDVSIGDLVQGRSHIEREWLKDIYIVPDFVTSFKLEQDYHYLCLSLERGKYMVITTYNTDFWRHVWKQKQ